MSEKAEIVKAVDATGSFALESFVHAFYLDKDTTDGTIKALPVIGISVQPSTNTIIAALNVVMSDALITNSVARVFSGPGAGQPDNQAGILANDRTLVYNNAAPTATAWEAVRTPNKFKTVSLGTTGNVWTPAGGKKFRLMSGELLLSKEAAAAGALVLTMVDGATTFKSFGISSAALVAIGNDVYLPFMFPGNGYLSIAADNVLSITFTSALTAGSLTVNVCGTEE